jgi:hypothetical protein
MTDQHANVHRKLYPRKAKALVNYKVFNEEGIKKKRDDGSKQSKDNGSKQSRDDGKRR